MKKLLLFAAALAVAATAYAGGKPCAGCPCGMEGVTRSVENLADGVRVTLVAKDPATAEAVRKMMDERHPGKCGCAKCKCPMALKGVDRKVEATADGVVMTVTAQDPETVKEIQAHLSAEAAGAGPHKGCKKECPRMRKAAA